MSAILTAAKTWLRNYIVDGVQASGVNQPAKSDGIAFASQVDSAITALQASQAAGAVSFDTQAHLFANLAFNANTPAIVYNDSTLANNGTYTKVGASGSG